MCRSISATIKIILLILAFSACSKKENLSTPQKVYISVVFTPEGFSNIGYNDATLKAIETLSQKYGYSYSFSVPESIEDGMAFYNAWYNAEIDDNNRHLFIFASGIYEKYLADAPHPSPDSGKDILIFEVEKELPYAYTFSMSYYGAAYMVASYYLSRYDVDFQVIAANKYLSGLDYLTDGIRDATDDRSLGSVNLTYISDSPDDGLDDSETAFVLCKHSYMEDPDHNIYIPYAGLSNLGVYRFSESNHQVVVGIDCISPDMFTYTLLCMNKMTDLALDDFIQLWINGKTPPKYTFYDLESGRVVVDNASVLEPYKKQLDEIYRQAVAKEKEYFSKRVVNE